MGCVYQQSVFIIFPWTVITVFLISHSYYLQGRSPVYYGAIALNENWLLVIIAYLDFKCSEIISAPGPAHCMLMAGSY